jgi:hypothetical protein
MSKDLQLPPLYVVGDAPGLVNVSAVAIHDPSTGAIVHMHHALTLDGADVASSERCEADAMSYAKRLGVDVENSATLWIPTLDTVGGSWRVDVEAKRLIEAEPEERAVVNE